MSDPTPAPAEETPPDDLALRRAVVRSARSVVVKVGTNVLACEDDLLDIDRINSLAAELAAVRAGGRKVVLVSSGAVGAGLGLLGVKERPEDLPRLQAAAATGQARLIRLYDEAFQRDGLHAAQLLVTGNDFKQRNRYLNVRNTLSALADVPVIPVVNENDTVSVAEIRFGDNDRLAALVTSLLPSPLLIVLTSVDGLLDGPPSDPNSRRVPVVREWTDELRSAATDERSKRGSGGMRSKLDAVRMATGVGENVVIADGRRPGVITDVLSGKDVGTLFTAAESSVPAWKRWIGQAADAAGTVRVDAGAERALCEGGRSLLAVGVVGVDGSFRRGDVVRLVGDDGEFARGLTNYSDEELRRIAGRRREEIAETLGGVPYREVVNRDNFALVEAGS